MMKILKFIGVLFAMGLCYTYVPGGDLICIGVEFVAVWKLVND
jgi:hypothetical protein